MRFLFSKNIKFKKNDISNLVNRCQVLIEFECTLDESSDDNYSLLIDDGINKDIDVNLYLTDNVKSNEALKQIVSIVGYYYV